MTTIICGSRRYEVTDEDRLWLLRAVEAEGPIEQQVAQTLVNCFAYLHSRKPKSCPTLTWLIRNYAQPLNPRWYPDGDLFAKWHARDPRKYTLLQAQGRLAKSRKTAFLAGTRVAVDGALTAGPVDIPANCTDYAARHIDASHKYREVTPKGHPKYANRLWTRAPGWAGYRVEAETKPAA
jgi:hypothetical protein